MNIKTKGNKLRIYIYGKTALNDINYLNKKLYVNLEQAKNNVYKVNDNQSNTEYLIIPGEINTEKNNIIYDYLMKNYQNENLIKANDIINEKIKEYSNDLFNESLEKEISEILSNYRYFYDVIIISVDNLLDEECKLAFKFFQDVFKVRSSQPFIFFLTKKEEKPNIQNLFSLVTNEFFDKRNVYAFKFPTNDEELEIINNYLYECRNYYHETGNGDGDKLIHSFNILICGKAGTGKSSFINQFLKKKVAKEGEGLSVTHKITKYTNKRYHIKLYDTPGFEDEKTVDMVFKAINRFDESINESKNHLDLILYFCKVDARIIYAFENELLMNLINKKKKIIFVLNDHGYLSSKQKTRYIDIMKTSLTQIINQQEKNKNKNEEKIDLFSLLNNIIIVKLRQSIDEDEDNKMKIKQCYGLDELFKKIYDMFEKQKVSIPEIRDAKDIDTLKKIISGYDVLKNIQSKEDVQINTKINCSKEILSKAKYDWFIWFGRDKRRKKLLEFINETYKTKPIDDIDSLLKSLKEELNKLKKKEEVAQFFEGISKFKNSFKIDGFNFNAYFYNEKTLLIGYLYLKQFKSELGEYDDIFKDFILDLSNAFNESINGFKNLENEWTKIYDSLKKNDSVPDWANQFFILDKPKNNEK